MSMLKVKLSNKLVTNESQFTQLRVGQVISGFNFGEVKNGETDTEIENILSSLPYRIEETEYGEMGSYELVVAVRQHSYDVVLWAISFQGANVLGVMDIKEDGDNADVFALYSNKSTVIPAVDWFPETSAVQGWQNITDGKYICLNNAKVISVSDIDGWNGIIVGAIEPKNPLQSKTVEPRIGDITVSPDEGYYGLSEVNVKSVENGLQEKSIYPQKSSVVVEPDSEYFGLSRVVLDSVESYLQEKVVEPQLTNTTVEPDSDFYVGLSRVTVNSVADKLQSKQVEPQTTSTTVEPDGGNLGLSRVTVGAVTSNIDSNIVPENIKNGVSILGVQGTMYGAMEITDFSYFHYYGARLDLLGKYDTSKSKNFAGMFSNCSTLKTIPYFNTSNGTNFGSMFNNCRGLLSVPPIDTSKGTMFNYIFEYCSTIEEIPIIDTSNATSMGSMFEYCTKLTTVPSLDLNKTSNVSDMFRNCRSLQNLTLLNVRVNLQIGSGTTWGHLLTIESLTQIISELIKDSATAHTLTVGSANLEKLANIYVRLTVPEEEDTTGKLPFEVCTSTDEGAMLISDYVSLKNWSLK